MEIILQRLFLTDRSTCGELSVDRRVGPYTLELPVRDGLPGSAIPPGRYQIVLAPSPKFQQSTDPWVKQYADAMPHIICPPRSLIMIHWGNNPEDTEGCVLVGLTHDLDQVGESRKAFESVYAAIQAGLEAAEVWITIQGGIALAPESAIDEADAT